MPRYSLPELAALPSTARQRLSGMSRLLILFVGVTYLGWQPLLLWISPNSWDPLWLRCVLMALCAAVAAASLHRHWERHLLRMTHGLAVLFTAHLYAVAAVNQLPSGYVAALFGLMAGGALVFFSMTSMLTYGGFTVALAAGVAVFGAAPLHSRLFLLTGVLSIESVLVVSAYRRAIAQRALLGELEESERRFRALAMRAPVGMYRCDLNGRCTFVNEEWCRIAGLTADEALGYGWLKSVHPDDRDRCARLWHEIAATGAEWSIEFRFLHGDGSVVWGLSRASLVQGEYGAQERVGITVDITARKQAEESLLRAKDLAEAATRTKSEFLAKMSHEIRTPMNGVLGMLELALETPLAPEQKDYVDTARASAANLLGILNDILDVSRIEARKLEIEATPFSLRQLLDASVRPLMQMARNKGLAFEMDVGLHVVDGLVGDALRLQQVLVNLVGNAIKFTKTGSIRVSVVQGFADARQAKLCFTVRDTGIGIPADRLASIFEPFTQIERVGAMSGTGLGLTISNQLVELMGGKIRVSSSVGVGSAFHVDLAFPRANVDPETLASSTVRSTDRFHAPPKRLRILVAEDNAVNARVVRHFLEKMGAQITIADNGRAALELATQQDFHLLFLDVQMPELTGLEVCRALRAHEKVSGGHRPIVMLTAQAMKGDREDALAAGADDYVTKPVTRRTLFATVARLMDQGAFGPIVGPLRDSSGKLAQATPMPSPMPTPLVEPEVKPETPVLDRVELLARVDGNRVLLAELVRLFCEERPTLLSAMEAALRDGDAVELARTAHKAKGAFGNLSAPASQQAAAELEALAKRVELAHATDSFLRLIQHVERLEAELRALTQDDRAA